MNMGAVYTRFYDGAALPLNRREALRYFGCGGEGALPAGMETLFDECVRDALAACVYRVCYAEFDITFPADSDGKTVDLGFTRAESRSLCRNLEGCSKVVAFAATVGMGMERLISRHSALSPVRGYAFQAIGAERIETLCDAFNADIARDYAAAGLYDRPRFSCGYGDFSIEAQPDFFRALDCTRKIGVTLSDGLLMTPSKSVTAIIGFSDVPRKRNVDYYYGTEENEKEQKEPCHAREERDKCKDCSASDCPFRRGK